MKCPNCGEEVEDMSKVCDCGETGSNLKENIQNGSIGFNLNFLGGWTPHKCPVCKGTGYVPKGFYPSTGTTIAYYEGMEICRTCGCSGIVWGINGI